MDLIDDVGAHEHVVEEVLRGSAPICTNSPDGSREVDHGVRTRGVEERFGFFGVSEVAVGASRELREGSFSFKCLADVAAQESCSSGDQDAGPTKFHGEIL